MKDHILQKCWICCQMDTKTLTIPQYMGISANHRSECKQIQILKKFHKLYGKEIREAASHGDTHPRLEKLRYKLGLSRPTQDYQELRDMDTHEGDAIDPYEYIAGREDGIVWIGSTPDPIGPFSNTNTDTDTDTTTTTSTTGPSFAIAVTSTITAVKDDSTKELGDKMRVTKLRNSSSNSNNNNSNNNKKREAKEKRVQL